MTSRSMWPANHLEGLLNQGGGEEEEQLPISKWQIHGLEGKCLWWGPPAPALQEVNLLLGGQACMVPT